MTRKVKVLKEGDTNLLSGSTVNLAEFEAENDIIRIRREAGEMNADYVIYSFGGTKLEAFFGCFAGDGTDGSAPGYYRVAYGDRHSGTVFDVTREEFESDIESFEATIIPLGALTGV